MQCINNLKQLALAVHGYHDVHAVLPASKIEYGSDPYVDRLMPWTVGNCEHTCGTFDWRNEHHKLVDSGLIGWRGPLHFVNLHLAPKYQVHHSRIDDIRDGTTNTLMIGEFHYPASSQKYKHRANGWAWSGVTGHVMPSTWNLRAPLDYDQCFIELPDHRCNRSWGAYHPGGLNWALADGSVRFISETVDMGLLMDLASIAGGEVAQVP